MQKGSKIYKIADNLLDDIVKEYIDYVSNPKHIYRQDFSNINMFTGEVIYNDGKGIVDMPLSTHTNIIGETVLDKENLPTPLPLPSKYNFLFLLDNIYRVHLNTQPHRITDEVWFTLSSEVLQLIDKYYNYKLKILVYKGILSHRQEEGKLNYEYTINNPEIFEYKDCLLHEVLRKKEQFLLSSDKVRKQHLIKRFGNDILPFVDKYEKSLMRLKVVKEDKAREIANSIDKPRACSYYNHIINKLKKGKQSHLSFDLNNRWYHIGTSLPRKLKECTNIQYSIDAKNSHPLLFNLLILDYYFNIDSISINNNYNIDNIYKLYYLINNYIYNNIINDDIIVYRYLRNSLCNYLKDSGIENQICAKVNEIPEDVFAYMYNTIHGMFWESFLEKFADDPYILSCPPEERRSEIKVKVFSKVFYSAQTKVYKDDKDKHWLEFFIKKYPNVWKIVVDCKNNLSKEIEGTEYEGKKVLSYLITRIESKIFMNILSSLFKKRGLWVIGIHDAIVVIEDNKIEEEKIREIMLKEYAQYGLIPTLSTDYF